MSNTRILTKLNSRVQHWPQFNLVIHQTKDFLNNRNMVIITNRRQNISPNFGNLVISEENLFQTILDLFLAGTDTTTGTLRWILLRLIHNPDVQTKCREEILKVRKSNRILHKINLF